MNLFGNLKAYKTLSESGLRMPARPPIPVVLTCPTTGNEYYFISYSKAVQFFNTNGIMCNKEALKKCINGSKPWQSWLVKHSRAIVTQNRQENNDQSVYVFVEDGIFQGKSVRVTTGSPKNVSIIDVIKLVCTHPYKVYDNLMEKHPHILQCVQQHTFDGPRQKQTPIINAQGIASIIEYLPGDNADCFRTVAAKALISFIDAHHYANLHNQTGMDLLVKVFGKDICQSFYNSYVRITHDDRVSVVDFIKCVVGSKHAHKILERVIDKHPIIVSKLSRHQFDGAGQKQTYVTDTSGLIAIANHIPGENGMKLRNAINVSIFDLSREPLLDQVVQPFALLSPTMKDTDITHFENCEVCYLLTFTFNDRLHMKFGRTRNTIERFTLHFQQIPGSKIYFIIKTEHSVQLEREFKKKMRILNHLVSRVINEKNQTEIISAIAPKDAEHVMATINESLVNKYIMDTAYKMPGFLEIAKQFVQGNGRWVTNG